MGRLAFFILLLVLILSLDGYAYSGAKVLFGDSQFFFYIYWGVSAIVIGGFIRAYIDFSRKKIDSIREVSTNLWMGFGFAIMVTKIVFMGLLLFQDIGLLLFNLFGWLISSASEIAWISVGRIPEAIGFSALLAFVVLTSMLYGITLGKYRYKVERVKLHFADLPDAFDGFRMIQISDIHAGSFDSVEKVKKGVELMKTQKADLIVFTGDLVNSLKDEINPFISTFSALSAPFGMYSILGNHDYYGMYQVAKDDPIARTIYMDDFNHKHEKMGFRLLRNESQKIMKDGDSIRIVGVENWGSGPFPKKGDLPKALKEVDTNEFTILLSHDPTHWDHHALPHPKKIQLTLSGHTHGMQFGIKFGNFKWSPVKYRYKRWMGLYQELGQYLYVNRGFGFLAWPGRVGMTPEITLIELAKK